MIGVKAKKLQRDGIHHFVEQLIEFDPELWEESIKSAVLGGCSPANIEAICNTYWYGDGDYGEWMGLRKLGDPELLQIMSKKSPWSERAAVTNVNFHWTEGKPETARVERIDTTHGSVEYGNAPEWLQQEATEILNDHFIDKGYKINFNGHKK